MNCAAPASAPCFRHLLRAADPDNIWKVGQAVGPTSKVRRRTPLRLETSHGPMFRLQVAYGRRSCRSASSAGSDGETAPETSAWGSGQEEPQGRRLVAAMAICPLE